MHPCWIKVLISYKENPTDPKIVNGSVTVHTAGRNEEHEDED